MMEKEEEKTRQEEDTARSDAPESPAGSPSDDKGSGGPADLAHHVHDLIIRAPAKERVASFEGQSEKEIAQSFGRQLSQIDGGEWRAEVTLQEIVWDGVYSRGDLSVFVKFVSRGFTYPLPGSSGQQPVPHLIILTYYPQLIRTRSDIMEVFGPSAAAQVILPHELANFLAGGAADISVNQYSLGDLPIGEVADDKLDFKDYAAALANLIDNPVTETPLTLAVHAAWGVGKSSLGKLIEALLKEKPAARPAGAQWRTTAPHRVFWFNAWRHDEADNLVTAFVAELSRDCFRNTSLLYRIVRPLPVSMRTKWMGIAARSLSMLVQISIALALVAVAIWAITKIGVDQVPSWLGLDKDSTQNIVAALASGSVLTAALPLIKWALSMRSSIEQFVIDPKEAASKGLIGDMRNYLAKLVRNSVPEGSRLVIFIDDIERCRGTGGIDLLEAINQLLMQHDANQEKLPIVVILLGDIDLVALAAGTKYKEIAEYNAYVEPITGLAASASAEDLKKAAVYHHGRRHLQKIVQLRFNLIAADPDQVAALSDSTARAAQERSDTPSVGALFVQTLKRLNPLTAVAEGRSLAAMWREHRGWSDYARSRRDPRPIIRILGEVSRVYGWILLKTLWLFAAPGYLAAYVAAEIAYPRAERAPGLHYGDRQLFTHNWGALSIGLAGIYLSILLAGTYLTIWAYPASTAVVPASMAQLPPWAAALIVLAWGLAFLGSGFVTLRQQDTQRFERYARGDQSLKPEERESALYKRIQESQALLRVTTDSDYFKTAQARVLQEISLTPRMLKRSANRIRLMMSVLYQRKLLGEQAIGRRKSATAGAPAKAIGVGPAALGKWVAFEENWPDLARMAMKEPGLLAGWESVARGKTDHHNRAATILTAAEKERVVGFLKKEPDLSPLVDQLINLREPKPAKAV
jgi:KAP family P-loop domain